MPWYEHKNKLGNVCRNKIYSDVGPPKKDCPFATCPKSVVWVPAAQAAQDAKPAPPPQGTKPAPPPPMLRLGDYNQEAQFSAAEQKLKLGGLREALEKTVPDDNLPSVIRFVAQSHYLKSESKKIADSVFPPHSLVRGSSDQIKNSVNQACIDRRLYDAARGPVIVATEDGDTITRRWDRNRALQEFFSEGMRLLEEISKENKNDVKQIAADLAEHSHMMDAKGYSRWVNNLSRQGPANGTLRTIEIDTTLPPEYRWAAYDTDGEEHKYVQPPFPAGKLYRFEPPQGPYRELHFYGKIRSRSISPNNVRLVVEVTKKPK